MKFIPKILPTLGAKIITSVSAVLIVIGIGYFYYAHKTGLAVLQEVAESKAHGVSDVGSSILTDVMRSGNTTLLKEALEAAVTSKHASEIAIFDRQQNLVLKVGGSEDLPAVLPEHFGSVYEDMEEQFLPVVHQGAPYLYVLRPIEKKPDCVTCHTGPEKARGYMIVKVPTGEIRAIAKHHRTINIAMVLLTFFGLGGGILITLTYIVIRPIKRLQQQIQEVEMLTETIEEGTAVEFPQSKSAGGNDEIAAVTSSFNRLVAKLNIAYRKLKDAHDIQLVQADKMATVGEMAASLAHEIRNPIAGILGALHVFAKGIERSDPRRTILNEMSRQLERINGTINDLLTYARPAEAVLKDLNINDVIRKVLLLLQPQYSGTNISVTSRLDDSLPEIRGDKLLLHQVFWNVALNAVHAVNSQGKITLESFRERSDVVFRVTDTGKGISVEDRKKLFKPFFTTKAKGTGLGLTICRRIVEQHYGTISIDSIEGEGTIVTIRLPGKGDELP